MALNNNNANKNESPVVNKQKKNKENQHQPIQNSMYITEAFS